MRTFSLGAGKDTVVFSSKSSADANTITGFTAIDGTSAVDTLQFNKKVFTGLSGNATAFVDVGTGATTASASGTNVYKADTLATLKTNLTAGASGADGMVFVALVTGEADAGIYAATLSHDGSSAGSTTAVKIGTLDGVDLSTLLVGNFTAS